MRIRSPLLAASILASSPALAQRTDDNATTQAEDAFGKSVGDQSIGIYNPFDVRGFSPVDAGNVRIEGLYFDQQTDLSDRIAGGSTIRVGLSAQNYPFPAPTGIADFTLRRPGKDALASVAVQFGPWEQKSLEVDVQVPIDGERLGFAGGGALYRDGQAFAGTPKQRSLGGLLRWAPAPNVEIVPFWSYFHTSNDEAQSLIFSAGAYLPKRIPRNEFFGQKWADRRADFVNYGVLARASPWDFDVRLGAFRSISGNDATVADLLFNTDLTGAVGRRVIVVENDDKSASTSGELRIARSFNEGPRRHTLIASARGRAQDRRYGGADLVELGASRSDAPDYRPRPVTVDGPKTQDRVRQTTLGLAYQGKWKGVGEMTLGVQKTRYTKRIADPDPAIVFPESRDSPALPSATAALYLAPRIALYAGYTRGLEESPVAPQEAINLNEAPPAIRTEQKDAGLRWTVTDNLTAVLGVFEVAKPYFNLDGAMRFRRLGMVTNRGIEFSIAGRIAKGLNLVAGNTLIDQEVSGDEVDRGVIGKKPVGSFVRHTIVSLDYRLPQYQPLSFDLFVESTSNRVGDRANSFVIPARSVASVGSRYRFKLGEADFLLRAQVQNIFNKFGWNNGGSGFFVPNGSRRYVLSLAADV